MYTWIWRHLPGPFAARALQALVLLAGAVTALFLWAFPWAERQLPYNDVTVPGPQTTSSPTPGPSSGPTSAPSELPAG